MVITFWLFVQPCLHPKVDGFLLGFRSRGGRWKPVAIATGNWGCGAFGGDPQLKALIQLMAAAETNRDMCYFTFGDETLRDSIFDMYSILRKKDVTVGKLYNIITGYHHILQSSKNSENSLSLYEYIKMDLNCFDEETDEDLDNCGSPKSTFESPNVLCGSSNSYKDSKDKKVDDTEINITGINSVDIKSVPIHNGSKDIRSSKSEKQPKLTDYFSRK